MEPFIGQVELFPYDFVPRGWAPCEGQTLKVRENQALSTLLKNRFGGDGKTTFGLPDLRKDAPPNLRFCIAVSGLFPSFM